MAKIRMMENEREKYLKDLANEFFDVRDELVGLVKASYTTTVLKGLQGSGERIINVLAGIEFYLEKFKE